MSYDDFRTATVIRYPYLWARQASTGETEGRKERRGRNTHRTCGWRSRVVFSDHQQGA